MPVKAKVREIKTPDAPATSKQTMLIFRLGGGDVRPDNLTMQQASDRIQELMEKKNETPQPSKSVDTIDFKNIFDKAVVAANAAGDKWWSEHCEIPYDPSKSASFFGMLDLCGFATLQVTDKRTSFYKWYTKTFPERHVTHSIYIPYKYQARQDLGLREACVRGAKEVFDEHGIKGLSVWTRVD
jgi:hypothetical protein